MAINSDHPKITTSLVVHNSAVILMCFDQWNREYLCNAYVLRIEKKLSDPTDENQSKIGKTFLYLY